MTTSATVHIATAAIVRICRALQVAVDEASHYQYLQERLEALGSHYGALPVHDGLWESAAATAHSLPARLAVESCVHEARGLDRLPLTIQKFHNSGDRESVELLQRIYKVNTKQACHATGIMSSAVCRVLQHLWATMLTLAMQQITSDVSKQQVPSTKASYILLLLPAAASLQHEPSQMLGLVVNHAGRFKVFSALQHICCIHGVAGCDCGCTTRTFWLPAVTWTLSGLTGLFYQEPDAASSTCLVCWCHDSLYQIHCIINSAGAVSSCAPTGAVTDTTVLNGL